MKDGHDGGDGCLKVFNGEGSWEGVGEKLCAKLGETAREWLRKLPPVIRRHSRHASQASARHQKLCRHSQI